MAVCAPGDGTMLAEGKVASWSSSPPSTAEDLFNRAGPSDPGRPA